MNILLVEPYFTGSHAAWARGYQSASEHKIDILCLSGAHWKWRMHGGAVTLADQFNRGNYKPDLILATDMVDLTTFLSLTRRRTTGVPVVMYFHENQLTYPWSPKDRDRQRRWDRHYAFINFASAAAADHVLFNSQFHMDSFLDALPEFLSHFPDHQEIRQVDRIRARSDVLPLGFDLRSLSVAGPEDRPDIHENRPKWPLILWNHRWEYDKNPEDFFAALCVMVDRNLLFDVVLVGEVFDVIPKPFIEGSYELGNRIIQSGFVDTRHDYAEWLWRCDIQPVTSNQDFFGGSVMEAMYCGCRPILPNRLAYPELVPSELHEDVFYEDFEALVAKLDASIRNFNTYDTSPLQAAAKTYDWSEMAPVYDRRFVALVEAT